jgi:hypothetical protein
MCDWSWPSVVSNCFVENAGSCTSMEQGKTCLWILVETLVYYNARCVDGYPDCLRTPSSCAIIKPALCDDETWNMSDSCHCCHHVGYYGSYGASVYRGSGYLCPSIE